MTQPVPTVAAYERADELLAALGVERSELPVELYDNGVQHVYVALPSKEDVAALKPDANALLELDLVGALACAGSGTSWKMRMFSPLDGVGEDAATGSAAGPLACHLGRHGLVPWGEEIEIEQGAEIGRPSTLYARATGSGGSRSSRSRSAARRSPSRAASSGFRSSHATASTSGSSGASERQKRPPSVER